MLQLADVKCDTVKYMDDLNETGQNKPKAKQ
jgi:hypothetical protein